MPEASILVTLRDQYSPGVQAMRSANSSFGKSLEETQQKAQAYQARLSGLVKQQGELQVQLVDAKKALKEAESAYKATGEAADADALASAKEKYEALNAVMKETVQASKDTQNALRNLESQSSSLSRQSGSESGLLSALSQAGLLKMAGDAAGEWANTLVGSAFGSDAGSLFSSALTGAASGAALGSFLPGIGTAIGAAIGGGIGLASAGSQIYQQRDEAFKSYVQEATQEQMEGLTSSISSGSATAAQRELDAIAFNKLLGEGTGDDFLARLRTLAADTPMEYSDLTMMSRALAKEPLDELIVTQVAQYIESVRPIGAQVTVVSAQALSIDVEATCTLEGGVLPGTVQKELEEKLRTMLLEMEMGAQEPVRYVRIMAMLLFCKGVVDCSSLTVNGGTENIPVTMEQVPVLGTVSIHAG